jgi:hypothetical protein
MFLMTISTGKAIQSIAFDPPQYDADHQLKMRGYITFTDASSMDHSCLFDDQIIASRSADEIRIIGIQLITEAALRYAQGGYDELGTAIQG